MRLCEAVAAGCDLEGMLSAPDVCKEVGRKPPSAEWAEEWEDGSDMRYPWKLEREEDALCRDRAMLAPTEWSSHMKRESGGG